MTNSGLVDRVLAPLDPRLHSTFLAELARTAPLPPWRGRLVLVGHRAAGKSSLLPVLARAFGLPPVDLDCALEERHRRPLASWVRDDVLGFRQAEREGFLALPARAVLAVGGGFVEHHGELLGRDTAVLVPISFETYCARLRADRSRPRLLPHRSLAEELEEIFRRREEIFARARTLPLAAVVRTAVAAEEGLACSGW